jgi:hypothetical protein
MYRMRDRKGRGMSGRREGSRYGMRDRKEG